MKIFKPTQHSMSLHLCCHLASEHAQSALKAADFQAACGFPSSLYYVWQLVAWALL